jgi:riboflavin kinase / FMN adenylyltransferase
MSYHLLKPDVLTNDMIAIIGFFDGVHLAHQALLKEALNWSKDAQKKPVVITFDHHPKSVIYGLDVTYITPLDQKVNRLKAAGFEEVFVIAFDIAFSQLSAERFLNDYLGNLYGLVCGYDFKFGHGGKGNTELLNAHPRLKTRVVTEIRHLEQKISSSVIRELIENGQVESLPSLLGRYYSIEGEVIHGEKKGRLIGYPTANLDTTDFVIPQKGVYASFTQVNDQVYASMTSVGNNPTLNAHHPLSVESYLFDFDETIYGQTITTYFVKRLRSELKFDAVADLIAQIDLDGIETLKVLKPLRKPLS